MDIKNLKRIITLVEQSEISELELEEEGTKIRISKYPAGGNTIPQIITMAGPSGSVPAYAPVASAPESASEASAEKDDVGIVAIESPMVGTFYRAPSPDSAPYVQVGDVVDINTVVCIVEAMKVMNEIKAGVKGKVTEIMVDNGQPVEFGRIMFKVKKA